MLLQSRHFANRGPHHKSRLCHPPCATCRPQARSAVCFASPKTQSGMSWLWTFGDVPELPPSEVQGISNKIILMPKKERCDPSTPRIIDVRTESEFMGGHVAGAVNASFLPPWSFEDRMKPLLVDLKPDTPVLFVCLSAHRSIGALKWLKHQGFTNVHQLQGGMKAWRAAGLPEVVAKAMQ